MRWFSMDCNMTFAFWLFSPLNHPRPFGSESRPSRKKTFLYISNSKNYKIKCLENILERSQTPEVVVGGIAPFTVFAGFCADDTFCHPPLLPLDTVLSIYLGGSEGGHQSSINLSSTSLGVLVSDNCDCCRILCQDNWLDFQVSGEWWYVEDRTSSRGWVCWSK